MASYRYIGAPAKVPARIAAALYIKKEFVILYLELEGIRGAE